MYEQGNFLHPHKLQEIPFSVNGNCGFPLVNALKQQYTGLDGGYDEVFANSEFTADIRLEVCSLLSV